MGTLNVNLIDNGGGSNVNMQCEGSNTSNLAQGRKTYFVTQQIAKLKHHLMSQV